MEVTKKTKTNGGQTAQAEKGVSVLPGMGCNLRGGWTEEEKREVIEGRQFWPKPCKSSEELVWCCKGGRYRL